jgi:hypothetical protein
MSLEQHEIHNKMPSEQKGNLEQKVIIEEMPI